MSKKMDRTKDKPEQSKCLQCGAETLDEKKLCRDCERLRHLVAMEVMTKRLEELGEIETLDLVAILLHEENTIEIVSINKEEIEKKLKSN
jgi:uridylate kinase